MPTIERRAREARAEYIASLPGHYSPRTIESYDWVIGRMTRFLQEADLETLPSRIGKTEVNHLLSQLAHLRNRTQRWTFSVMDGYLMHHGNPIIHQMRLSWPKEERINVDWLDPLDALEVMSQAKGVERIVVHLELNLGLRRIEVRRLRVKDIGPGYLNVWGKGRMGGKWRQVPFHRDTLAEIQQWMMIRDSHIAMAMSVDPSIVVPEELVIYRKYKYKPKLAPYGNTGIDNVLKGLSDRMEMHFSHHTFRRTFGRTLWQAGVELETIMKLMGHEDRKTTIDYLGIRMDDMMSAMQKLAVFQDARKPGISKSENRPSQSSRGEK